ncbi:hypothetical protein JHN57_34805, partial [Streptomyces sp. MBT59]|nr:hypothetical protein [Streptomyces sp. MBT59]
PPSPSPRTLADRPNSGARRTARARDGSGARRTDRTRTRDDPGSGACTRPTA